MGGPGRVPGRLTPRSATAGTCCPRTSRWSRRSSTATRTRPALDGSHLQHSQRYTLEGSQDEVVRATALRDGMRDLSL